jgi:hypothetical protein
MAEEINIALKDSLDVFFAGQPLEPFMQPISGGDDLLAKGLLDENMNPTSRGILFTTLQDAGAIDMDGKLTEKGHAYAMPKESALEPENLWAFKVRETDGVDDTPTTFGQMVGAVGDFVWDAGAGLGKRVGYEAESVMNFGTGQPNSKELDAKLTASGAAIAEGSIESTKMLAQYAQVGAAWIGQGLGKVIGMDEEADSTMWKARQANAKAQHQNTTLAVGKTLEGFDAMAGTVEAVAAAKEQLPKEEFAAIIKQGDAFGSFVDPTVILPAGAAAKAGTTAGVTTRIALKAEQTLAKVAKIDSSIAAKSVELAAAQRAALTAQNASEFAGKMADDLTVRAEQTGDAIARSRAQQAYAISQRTATEAATFAERAPRIGTELEQLTAIRGSLATRIPEATATAAMRAVEIGKNLKSVPVTFAGDVTERIGAGLVKIDDGLTEFAKAHGGEQALNLFRTGVGLVGFQVAGVPGFAAGIAGLRSGKAVESLGKFTRVVGSEMSRARGQVPFWQRVANHSDLTPAHRATAHMLDTFTAGGAIPGAIRRTSRGVLAAYPIDLAFEMLADGGSPNADTFKRAFAESLVIGGSSAMLGGAFMGTKKRHRQLAIGDERNFRSDLGDPDQTAIFDALPNGVRRSIATYSAANPQLQVRFTTSGSSSFEGNTATINVASANPLRPLIAHEVMHNVVIRNQMEQGASALLIGDGETGGLLRSNDGTLDANFNDFWQAYNARMTAAGGQPVDIHTAALEYYVDSAADHVAGMAESGELGAMAGKTKLRRSIERIVEATLPRLPIIRDIHFKLGGLMEQDGKMVMGNGLLADGIRELPQARAMTRRMLRAASGRSVGNFDPVGNAARSDGGVVLPVQKGDKAVLDKLVSIFETEEVNGQTRVKYDANGDPIPLNPATDMARSRIGLAIGEAIQSLRAKGKAFKPGEMIMNEKGAFEGTFLGNDVIREIGQKGILNGEQMRMLRNINSAARDFTGSRFMVINHPATKKVGKKVRYATLAPTLRDVVPVGLQVTKDGNLLVALMSVTQLNQNITTRAASKTGKRLYNGDTEAIRTDVGEVMKLHRADQPTLPYFAEKYGGLKAEQHRNFINTVFGEMAAEQRGKNPMLAEDNIGTKNQVFRTYRLDRISQATKMTGDTAIPMPFVYDAVKMNLMPNGLPTVDADGNPVVRNMPENVGLSQGDRAEFGREQPGQNSSVSLREPQNVGRGNEKAVGILKPLEGFSRPDLEKPWVREERSAFDDIDGQEAELAAWAASNGRLMDVLTIQEIRAKEYETRRGNEHDVVFAPDGVYRFTNGDKYGMPYRTPSEYLARWDKSNKLFPQTAVEFVGFYQKPSGVGVIVTKQPFIKGTRGTAKQIQSAMEKRGFLPTGNHSFRHPETGIELYDAHEDNVLFDSKGNIMPFDVWVNDPNNVLEVSSLQPTP